MTAPMRRGGYAYLEVLVAVLLVAIALLPALDALQAGLQASRVHETLATQHQRIAGRMESVLGESVGALALEAAAASGSPTSYSDPAATPDRLLVYLSLYDADDTDGDGDRFTGGESDLVWVRVEMAGTPHLLESLATP